MVSVQIMCYVILLGAAAAKEQQRLEVTVGSTVKLRNKALKLRLHSHEITYGWGSHQQSVTGMTSVTDANSYWQVRSPSDERLERGSPIKCGQTIRITHIRTGRNLHSHHIKSPMSMEQEVSCFGDNGEGDHLDDWIVICPGKYWMQKQFVRFRHRETDAYLGAPGNTYREKLEGQYEITSSQNDENAFNKFWKTKEGVIVRNFEEGDS